MTDAPVSLRLSTEQRQKIQTAADGEMRSFSNMVVVLLTEALNARKAVSR